MGLHRIALTDVNADANKLCPRKFGLLAGQRDAFAMCDFLRAAGINALPSEDGAAIIIPIRSSEARRQIHCALVYFIVAAAYRFDADIRVLTATGTHPGGVNSN
jgi:hypothetical protein